jgi:hypothetical protein
VALRACGHLRAGLSTSTPGGKLEGEYDDVVIGGGIMGSSTAYEVNSLATGLAVVCTLSVSVGACNGTPGKATPLCKCNSLWV